MNGPIYWIICFLFSWKSTDGGLPTDLYVGSGESLFLYWRPTQNPLTGCNVTTPTKNIDMFTDSDPNFVRPLALNFKNGYCCVKVKKVETMDNGTWYMWASIENKNFETSTNVTVKPPVVVVNRSVSVMEGSFFTVNCGNDNAIYCRMISPKGISRTYIGPCKHSISNGATIFDHEGTWTCSFALHDFVREFKANTELSIIEDTTKEMVLVDLPNEYALYCKMPKDVAYAKMCRITTPYGLDLYMTPGKVYKRYTYYGLKPSHCGVTIPKPLAPQDIGPWKCQLIYSTTPSSAEVYGGYMTIGIEKRLRKIEVPSKKIIWTDKYSDHYLICHVPYAIQYCWFKSPNGTVYNIIDKYNKQENTIQTQGFKFGDCALMFDGYNLPSTQNSTGKWTCNIGLVKESVAEISETIEVLYSEIPMIPNQMEISGEIGSSLKLGCQTAEGQGITYCRLIRPDGKGLSVDPTKNNSDYSYSGKGFIFGHCGITIHNLKSYDVGKWMCAAKLVKDLKNQEYTTHVMLIEEKGSLVVVYILAGVGGLFSLLGASYVIVRKFEFKINYRNRRDDETNQLIENDGNAEEQEEELPRSRRERVNNIVKFIRRRSPRPSQVPDSSYI